MDMLYYIYIGSNRVTIDHLSKIAGGMFMAVSSCNKAAKVIDGIRERYNTSILYGGSANASNAKELFSNPDVDGGLIGGASLGVDKFMPIIEAF